MGISGRIATYFQDSQLTPLIALVAFLLGLFAVMVTPREEEPQINVTMANVFIPFPGASSKDVESLVATPAEQVLSQMTGVEHVFSVSRPGMAVLTVQFKVGVPRVDALVRLYDTINSNRDWVSPNLGTLAPIIKPKGIDDVPVVTLTFWSKDPKIGAYELERVAHAAEIELKRVPGTREVQTLGGPGRAVRVLLDPDRMNAYGISALDVRNALQLSNVALPTGKLVRENREIVVETGDYLRSAADARQLVVGTAEQRPVYLSDVAEVRDGPNQPSHYVWIGTHQGEHAAVTLQITKKPGENAVDVSDRVMKRVAELHGTVIPDEVQVSETRNYGATANEKALKLIEKLIFATASVVVLVFATLGRREALIVGLAVMLTLATTLFASWAWGFTLNRVSLFALIFSIGILVDDAIVVVENIHRHRAKAPETPLSLLIPLAVDEVGGPTILATFTVIAALLPMAFVSGLMGPYMSPIPINASMGMVISLAIAFSVTPWLACKLLGKGKPHEEGSGGRLERFFARLLGPFVDSAKNRLKLWLAILVLILLSVSLAGVKLVILKMLPFDNKSEFQVVVDMPAGTPVEDTAAALHDMGAYVARRAARSPTTRPTRASPRRSTSTAWCASTTCAATPSRATCRSTSSPRASASGRATTSRPRCARRWRKSPRAGTPRSRWSRCRRARRCCRRSWPRSTGRTEAGRIRTAERVRAAFAATPDIVSIDDSVEDPAPRLVLKVDQAKAALLGVSARDVVETMRMGLLGEDVTPIHDGHSKYEVPVRIELPAERQGRLDEFLKLALRTSSGTLVPLSELVNVVQNERDRPIYHKDLLPVVYVVGDKAGRVDSPLYGMFAIRGKVVGKPLPDGGVLGEYFIHQPSDPYRQYSIKWDGEWQVTYETFRDMGLAYAVGLILIYLLVVAQFRSYLTPLIIMAPIPLTVIGVMPGHALLGANFTATSMIGMIALAGIIVRNSILLVDFVNQKLEEGVPLRDAVLHSAAARAKPIALTGLAAMIGATFILDDPIFQGLAISLIFGIFVSTVLTLVVIPVLYYVAMKTE